MRAGATPEAAAPAKSVSSQFASAVAAFDAGRLDEAKQLFEAVAGRDDQHAAARYNLGVIAERQGDLAAAERQYRDALAVDPVRARALLGLGKVLRAQGRAEEAVKLLQDALQRPGLAGDPALLNALAAAERSAGQLPQAEATARQVLVRVPDDAEAYRTLALCALDQNNPRLAELYALTARKRSEKDAATANTLGLVYLKLDERPRALAELQRALALDPSFAPAQLNLGALALSSRDYATAEKAFSRALELQPWSRQALLLRAWALDGLRAQDPRRGADAGAAFEKVLGLQPDDPEATCGAGFGYAADKAGYDRAVPFLERCQKLASTPQERQAAEAKLRTIQAVMSATQQKKEEAAPQGSGGSGEGSEPPADGPPAPPK
ncbi:MAG TPA: tetratricopeptide repeat protein [Myxococcales bacterium]|nr:tetratricopeptide repeat protein [Myxococcales bacterium]